MVGGGGEGVWAGGWHARRAREVHLVLYKNNISKVHKNINSKIKSYIEQSIWSISSILNINELKYDDSICIKRRTLRLAQKRPS